MVDITEVDVLHETELYDFGFSDGSERPSRVVDSCAGLIARRSVQSKPSKYRHQPLLQSPRGCIQC